MALIGTISGSNGTSTTAISGSVVIADRPPGEFPSLPSNAKFYVSGTRDVNGPLGAVAIFGGDIFVTGGLGVSDYVQMLPVNELRIPTNTSASYIYTSGSTNDMYFTQYTGPYTNTTRLRWLESSLSSGLLHGGILSTQNGTTTFSITSGSGIIVYQNATTSSDPYPTIRFVQFPAYVSQSLQYSGSAQITYIAIDPDGDIDQSPIAFNTEQFKDRIVLGRILHQSGSVSNGATNTPTTAYAVTQNTNDFVRAFGPLKISGHFLSASGSAPTMSIIKTAGSSYVEGRNYSVDPNNPNIVNANTDLDVTVSKIYREYVSGSTPIIDTGIANAGYTVLDPTLYNNNGTLAAVANGEYTIQRVFWFPRSVNRALFVYYGSAKYATMDDAIAGIGTENFIEGGNTAGSAILVGYICLKGDASNLLTASQARVYQGGLFRGSAGASFGGAGGGASLPGGLDTHVQFNDDNAFGGESGFTFNKLTNSATLVGDINAANANLSSNVNAAVASITGNAYTSGTLYAKDVSIFGNLTATSGSTVISGSGPVSIDSSDSTISIGSAIATGSINIGSSGNRSITIGNINNTSLLSLSGGVGGITLTTDAVNGNISVTNTLTGSLNLFNDTGAGTVNIVGSEATGTRAVNIAIGGSNAKTVNIGNNTVAGSITTIDGGTTGGVNIATSTVSTPVNIGTGATATNQSINIGTATGKIVTIGSTSPSVVGGGVTLNAGTAGITMSTAYSISITSSGGSPININNTNAAGGVGIGNGTGTGTINIAGSLSTGARTINVGTGGTGAKTIIIGENTIAGSIVTLAAGSTGGVNIATAAVATPVNIANNTVAGTVNIGTGSATQTLNFGTGIGAKTVTLGSRNSTSTTLINAGTGGVTISSGSTTAASIGNNVFFYVSGNIATKPATSPNFAIRGTTVFGGDVVISGTLFGGSPLYIGDDVVIGTNQILGSSGGIAIAFTGSNVTIPNNLILSGNAYFGNGLTGSLTKLNDGSNYLRSGVNVQISTGSSGEITISVPGALGGDVVGPASATNNAIAVYDGATGKLIKNSNLLVGTRTTTQAYVTASVNLTDYGLALIPNGTGSLSARAPDGTTVGGNARGSNAVDFQMVRASSDQVAGGIRSVIVGGQNNRAIGESATIVGGSGNTVSARFGFVGSGENNSAGEYSFVGAGNLNTISSTQRAFIGAGRFNSISGGVDRSAIVAGADNTIAAFTGGGSVGEDQFIGGGSLNLIRNNGFSTIAGGQSNTASSAYTFIGGGNANVVSGSYSVIVGGQYNSSSADYVHVGGGQYNTGSAAYASVGGGFTNRAGAAQSSISGGGSNTINLSRDYSFIGGGQSNTIQSAGTHISIVGGQSNTAQTAHSTIGGGQSNSTSTNTHQVIGGGLSNRTVGRYSTIPGGQGAITNNWGELSFAAGFNSAAGDAQTSMCTWRRSFTNTVAPLTTELFLDGNTGGTERFVLASNTVVTFQIQIVIVDTVTGTTGGYIINGVAKNIGGTSSLVGATTITSFEDSATWSATVDIVDSATDYLRVQITTDGTTNSMRTVATGIITQAKF